MSTYYVTIAADPSTPIQVEATQVDIQCGNLVLLVNGRVVACFAQWVYYTRGRRYRGASGAGAGELRRVTQPGARPDAGAQCEGG